MNQSEETQKVKSESKLPAIRHFIIQTKTKTQKTKPRNCSNIKKLFEYIHYNRIKCFQGDVSIKHKIFNYIISEYLKHVHFRNV